MSGDMTVLGRGNKCGSEIPQEKIQRMPSDVDRAKSANTYMQDI